MATSTKGGRLTTSKGGGHSIAEVGWADSATDGELGAISPLSDREGSRARGACHQQQDGADDRQWQDTFTHGKGLQEQRRSARCLPGMCCSLRLELSILRAMLPFFVYPTFS